ncbi:hypothetical protein Tco_1460001, partial [Tanacetum coccineum]
TTYKRKVRSQSTKSAFCRTGVPGSVLTMEPAFKGKGFFGPRGESGRSLEGEFWGKVGGEGFVVVGERSFSVSKREIMGDKIGEEEFEVDGGVVW